jgi:hypothetical protein
MMKIIFDTHKVIKIMNIWIFFHEKKDAKKNK